MFMMKAPGPMAIVSPSIPDFSVLPSVARPELT